MRNIDLLVDPVLFTLTGDEQDLPVGIKVIKPNVGCVISSLKKTDDNTTNYATSYATLSFSTDNYTYIGCGGNNTWGKITGTALGTLWLYK